MLLAERYRVTGRLGSGGMAVVFLACDERLDRMVAVKRLHAESPRETAQRFQREAKLGASLNHPNVVDVYDTLADGEDVLIVMEYVDGQTLGDLIRGGALAPDRTIGILRCAAAALDHAHACGVVHRDVKPANLLIRKDGEVKLADLGIGTASEATRITHTGAMIGTPAYMAPEQLEGDRATPASDVYSLAAVAFEMLGGRKARTGRTAMEIVQRITNEPPPDLREVNASLPEEAAEVLKRGMAADPGERPGSARELVDALARALGVGENTAPAAPAPRAPAGPPLAAASASEETEADTPESAPPAPRPTRTPGPRAQPAPATGVASPRAARAPVVSRSRRRLVVPVLLALAGATAVAVLLLSSGEDSKRSPRPAGPPERAERARPRPAASLSPERTVRAFYERAAADDFASAWALAGPGMRSAFGNSLETFSGDLRSLTSIRFVRLEETTRAADSATVSIQTIARHTDRVDRCQGDLRLTRGSKRQWLVNPSGISCDSEAT